jgi:hypothetical protein
MMSLEWNAIERVGAITYSFSVKRSSYHIITLLYPYILYMVFYTINGVCMSHDQARESGFKIRTNMSMHFEDMIQENILDATLFKNFN